MAIESPVNGEAAAVLDPRALEALLRSPDAARQCSALSDRPFLLIDANASHVSSGIEAALAALPCPVIGIGAAADPLAAACDLLVAAAADARLPIDNIRRCPLAATVLVQTLRGTAKLPMEPALNLESLAYASLQAGPEFRRWLASRQPTPAEPRDSGPPVRMQRDGESLTLELNRPSNRNAMSVEMRDALIEALSLVLADDSIREVRLRARGKCFSTGGDLAEFGTAPDPVSGHIVRALALPGRLLAFCAARVTVEVHGACIGSGIEFPAFAGRVLARANAWFQLPELKYGLIPGAGGCVSIARRVGRQRTAWMVLSGARIDARTALEWGLVDAIV